MNDTVSAGQNKDRPANICEIWGCFVLIKEQVEFQPILVTLAHNKGNVNVNIVCQTNRLEGV